MNFSSFMKDLRRELVSLARAEAGEFAREAAADARSFLERSAQDLRRWTKMLAAGELDADEFASLVRGLRGLAKMETALQAGLAKARAERLAKACVEAVVQAGLGLL